MIINMSEYRTTLPVNGKKSNGRRPMVSQLEPSKTMANKDGISVANEFFTLNFAAFCCTIL